MKQKVSQSKNTSPPTKPKPELNLTTLVLIILFSAITGLLVNFFNNIHFSNLLLQANGQANSAQSELQKEQYDVKFLVNNWSGQLNCFDLQSNFARNACTSHNNGPSNPHS